MMWLVRIALSRPYTFVCGSILILIAGIVAMLTMSVDIFPDIPIPVVTAVWTYAGMSPEEMEQRITSNVERAYSTTVSGIEHIESQSIAGTALVRIYFHPDADLPTAMTQVTVGLQAGGQAFSQIIFFENKAAFDQFASGNFEFGAGVSAVAIKSGASGSVGTTGATASASSGSGKTGAGTASNYRKGMAVFTIAKGGLMYEASLGGQKFSYKPVK